MKRTFFLLSGALMLTACGSSGSPTGGTGGAGGAGGGASSTGSGGSPDVGTEGDGKSTIGPNYADAPELTVAPGTPRGVVYQLTMDSTASKIFPGIDGPFTRGVWVYVPKQYVDGADLPFTVVQDAAFYLDALPAALDTMIARRELPVMAAVLLDPGPGEAVGERSYEYDTLSDDYARFVEDEVLPAIADDKTIRHDHHDLHFTKDPDGRAAMGGSSGGAAAFTMGWFRPELYHRILTYSGTFVNQHPDASYPHGAWEYHEHLIADSDPKPLRVALEVGEYDNNWDDTTGDGMHDWVAANKAMAAALEKKGYHYRFVYARNAGHVDDAVLRQTLPDTLRWLWRGYRTP